MASQFSNENFQTENPFVDKLIKNLKVLTYNCIVKDEYEASKNETKESLEEAELYSLCVENRVTLAAFPYIPEQFMRMVGLPERIIQLYKNFNNELMFIPLDQEGGPNYRAQLVEIMRPWYIMNFEEKNAYYRMITGKPPLDEWGIPVRDYTKYLPEGFTYRGEFVHEIGVEACKELDRYGVLSIMKSDYKARGADIRYLDYLTAGISLYDARRAYDFMILYTPPDADAYITEEWKLKYQERREYLVSSVYSTALEMTQNPHYHAVMQVYLLIMTMVDMLADVQSHIVKKDILDRRCIEYIFSMYGIPYFRAIPYRFQERICLNIHKLIKFKSCTKDLLELARIFDMEDCEFFKYYLFKKRRMDIDGNFIWSVTERLKCSGNDILEEEIRVEAIEDPPEEQPLPVNLRWYNRTVEKSSILRELKFVMDESSSTAQESTVEALEEEPIALEGDPLFGNDYHERYVVFPFDYFLQKRNVVVVIVDDKVLEEEKDYYIYGYNHIRIKGSIVENASTITYHFYYDKATKNEVFEVDTAHGIKLLRYTSDNHTSNSIDLSEACLPEEFWENKQEAIVLVGSIFLCPGMYSFKDQTLVFDDGIDVVGRQATVLLPYSPYLKSVFEKHDVIATEEGQTKFAIPQPFTHYTLHGNSFFVTIGSTFIDPERYKIELVKGYEDASIEFVDGTTVPKGRKVVFNFLYSRNAIVNGIELETLETTFYPTHPFQTDFPFSFPIRNYVGSEYKVYLNVFGHWLSPQTFTYTNDQIVLLDQTIAVRTYDPIKVRLVYYNGDRTQEEYSHILVAYDSDTAMTNHQTEFKIVTPIDFYVDKQNKIIVDINGDPLEPDEYSIEWISPNAGNLTLLTRECFKGQVVNYTFVYNGDSEYLSSMAIQQVSDNGLSSDSVIPLEYPFFPYVETGQDFVVVYGSVVVDKSRIHLVGHFGFRIDDFNPDPNISRTITILYIYSNWYSTHISKIGLIRKDEIINLTNATTYDVPEPFENYVLNKWPYYVTYGDNQLMGDHQIDVVDGKASSFPPEDLINGVYGDSITFHFIYLVKAPYVWPEMREDFSLTTDLRFCKIPVKDLYSSKYLLNQTRWKDYDIIVHGDGWWAGKDYKQDNYNLIKSAIYEMPFNYSRTKYYGVGRIIELSSYAARLSFFYAALFDDVLLENQLNVGIPSLSDTHTFNIAHLILYMTCLTYTFNGVDDIILENPNDILYASGFNYRASLEDLKSYIINHHYNPDQFPIFDMIIPTAQISDLGEFINIQRNNEEVYHTIRHRMIDSQDYREYQIWKHLYDALMTWKFNTEFYRLDDGRIATTYSEFLRYKDSILYTSLMEIRAITDREKQIEAVSTTISDICFVLEGYIKDDLAKNIFSEFAGYSTSSILSYMMKVVEFFKSYKIIFREKGEIIGIGIGGTRTINEDGVFKIYDYAYTKTYSNIKDYVEIQEVVHTKNVTKVSEGEELNEQGNRWFREDCQIITHHKDGTEEKIDVQ